MKLMLRSDLRLWPFPSFLGILDLKTGVIITILFAVLNKVAGVYGLIAVLTGAGGSFAQISLYIYSVLALVAFGWGLQVVKAEDARQTLYFAHLFSADYVLSTIWTAYFAAVWWWHTPHDGARQANSQAQEDLIAVAKLSGPPLSEEQRVDAARAIWAREQGSALAAIVLASLVKIYLALIIYSFAQHLRKGSYRALPLTLARSTPAARAAPEGSVLPEEDEDDVEDFYRVPLRTPPPPQRHTSGLPERTKVAPPPAEEDEDEVLFDDEYPYASSGTTSKATSKRGTESSTSRSASTDNEDAAGERTAVFAPSRTARATRV